MKTQESINTILGQIDELQMWFASRPYGFSDNATPDQLKQFSDREREMDRLIERLEMLKAA